MYAYASQFPRAAIEMLHKLSSTLYLTVATNVSGERAASPHPQLQSRRWRQHFSRHVIIYQTTWRHIPKGDGHIRENLTSHMKNKLLRLLWYRPSGLRRFDRFSDHESIRHLERLLELSHLTAPALKDYKNGTTKLNLTWEECANVQNKIQSLWTKQKLIILGKDSDLFIIINPWIRL